MKSTDYLSKLAMLMCTYVELMAYFSMTYAMTSVALNTPQFGHIQQFAVVCDYKQLPDQHMKTNTKNN